VGLQQDRVAESGAAAGEQDLEGAVVGVVVAAEAVLELCVGEGTARIWTLPTAVRQIRPRLWTPGERVPLAALAHGGWRGAGAGWSGTRDALTSSAARLRSMRRRL
jgi:hypothetical protein